MHRSHADVVGRRRRYHDVFAGRHHEQILLGDEGEQFIHLRGCRGDELTARRVMAHELAPHLHGCTRRVDARGGSRELGLVTCQLALADRQQPVGRQVDQFLGAVSRFDRRRADGKFAGCGSKTARL
jgi:hypothetical protein